MAKGQHGYTYTSEELMALQYTPDTRKAPPILSEFAARTSLACRRRGPRPRR